MESRGTYVKKVVDTEVTVDENKFNEHESNRTYIDKDLDEDKPKLDLMSKEINTNSDLLAHNIDKNNSSLSQSQTDT